MNRKVRITRNEMTELQNDIFAIQIIAECQDLIRHHEADIIMEQIKIDAFNRTYGHLIEKYIPARTKQNRLSEGLIADLAIAAGTMIPGYGALVAAGGTAYYVINMVRAISKGNNMQAFFEGLSAMFTFGQINYGVGTAIGIAAKAIMAPFKIALRGASSAALKVVNVTASKTLTKEGIKKAGKEIGTKMSGKAATSMGKLLEKFKPFMDGFTKFFSDPGKPGYKIVKKIGGSKVGQTTGKAMEQLRNANTAVLKIAGGAPAKAAAPLAAAGGEAAEQAAKQAAKEVAELEIARKAIIAQNETNVALKLISAKEAGIATKQIDDIIAAVKTGGRAQKDAGAKLVKAEMAAMDDALAGYMKGARINVNSKELNSFFANHLRKGGITDDVIAGNKSMISPAVDGPFKGFSLKSIPKDGKDFLIISRPKPGGGIEMLNLDKQQAYIFFRSSPQSLSGVTQKLSKTTGYTKGTFQAIDKSQKARQIALRSPTGKAYSNVVKIANKGIAKGVDDVLNTVGPKMVDDFGKTVVGQSFQISERAFAQQSPAVLRQLGKTLGLADDAAKQFAQGNLKGLSQVKLNVSGFRMSPGKGLDGAKNSVFEVTANVGGKVKKINMNATQLSKYAPDSFLDDMITKSKIVDTYKESIRQKMKDNFKFIDEMFPKGIPGKTVPPPTPDQVLKTLDDPKIKRQLIDWTRAHLRDPNVIGMKQRTYFMISGGLGVATGVTREITEMIQEQEAMFAGIDPITLSADELLMIKQVEGTDIEIPDFRGTGGDPLAAITEDAELRSLNEWLYKNQRGRRRRTNIYGTIYN